MAWEVGKKEGRGRGGETGFGTDDDPFGEEGKNCPFQDITN